MEKEMMPRHIGIIMDGNRRWAKSKGLPIIAGHKTGADTLEKITRYANKIGLEYLSVFAFSTENWKRSEEEVNGLMKLLQAYLDDFSKKADTENIRIKVLGDISVLSEEMQKNILKCMERTKNNTGVTLNVCLNYGGRNEIVKMAREVAELVKNGEMQSEDITEEVLADHIYAKGEPDLDLVIRTSGEKRLSGFLTWQSTYAELLFIDKYWPDFTEEDMDEAINEYQKRNRKFGGK